MPKPVVALQTLFIVDDDDDFRDSLTWLLDALDYPIRSYASGEAFLEAYDGTDGCLLLDVRMPGISGLALQQELKKRAIRLPIIIITGHGDIPMAVNAIKNGALDFIEKPFDDQLLLDHVHNAMRVSKQWASEALAADQVIRNWETLSRREKQVMDLVVTGKANKVIAEELGISPKTVEVHRARVMSKMRADSLPALVTQAGLIPSP